MTQLPPSPFISNPSVTHEPPTEGPAVALSRTSVLDAQTDATAEPISVSEGGWIHGPQAHAPSETEGAVSVSAAFSDNSEPPSNEGRPQETPASAPTKNPDVGVLDAIDCIHEIFHYARKLMRGHQGFVLDEAEFMADVEEEPLFIRDGDHLRRWEA